MKLSIARLLTLAGLSFCATAWGAMGVTTLAESGEWAPVTVFYPTVEVERPQRRGPFELQFAADAVPARGNGRLVVISHGSGASPWVQTDIARAFVAAGFVVALPWHRGDNFQSHADVGPVSWERRPLEVSAAIDRLGADTRFAPLLALDRVGLWGMSAGGHTVLAMAGGRWSPAEWARHCQERLEDDFHGCVGLVTRLRGNAMDGLKKAVARIVIRIRFGGDDRWRQHHDPRIAVAVAAVPLASDFDVSGFATAGVPLGLVRSGADLWLPTALHLDRVLAACTRCELLADVPDGGHGLWLSPLPPGLTGLEADLILDPPGFDRPARRAELAAAHDRIVAFVARHVVAAPGAPQLSP